MKILKRMRATAKAATLLGFVMIGWWFISATDPTMVVDVKVPELSSQGQAGKDAFDTNCAACHGINAGGSKIGPPLVHDIYKPDHHIDAAFRLAVMRGVRRHHWNVGNMPAQPEVTDEDVMAITRYVREIQEANEIF